MYSQPIKYHISRHALSCVDIKKITRKFYNVKKRRECDISKSNLFNCLICCLYPMAICYHIVTTLSSEFYKRFSYFFRYTAIISCIMKQLQSSYSPLACRQKCALSCVAEMDFDGSRYYTLNRVMLSSIGLWPYQKAWPIRIQRFSCVTCVISCIIVQVYYCYFL